ncbi:MAG: efflux RND transporter periplasmic adaptor subunit [Armatimonadetes bacterium]|nr:efflux RND transporter periplasmic adaptor subunit [Armatimonadota bacterium]
MSLPRAIAAALLALTLAGCGGHRSEQPAATAPRPTFPVRTATARPESLPEGLELSGTFTPVRQATLATRISGRILELAVEEGERVQAGETLIRIDARDLLARTDEAQAAHRVTAAGVEQAEAGVETARARLLAAQAGVIALQRQISESQAELDMAARDDERYSFLYREGAVPKQIAEQAQTRLKVARSRLEQTGAAVDRARAEAEAARAGLDEARTGVGSSLARVQAAEASIEVASASLPYADVRAPFDGVVIRKLAYAGDLAVPGAPLLEIQDVRDLQLDLPVPEESLGFVRTGAAMPIRVDALKKTVGGTVRQIVPAGDPVSRSFLVRLRVPNADGRLLPGMYGRVSLQRGSHPVLRLPLTAIRSQGQLEGVFLLNPAGDRAELHLVKTGRAQGDRVEILSGLEEGDRFLVAPPPDLQDGDPVKVES